MFVGMVLFLVSIALARQPGELPSVARQPAKPQVVEPAIIPEPQSLLPREGVFRLSPGTLLEATDSECDAAATYLRDVCSRQQGITLRSPADNPPQTDGIRNKITLAIAPTDSHSLGDEGYILDISPQILSLRAAHPTGLARGVSTIAQLIDFGKLRADVPCLFIVDRPRYPHRGMLLDCCRHFMTKDFVKRYIDLLAYHKMNVLHWHLTEDQGWRIEIKKYPKLTEVGAWRGEGKDRYGGFYTQADIREIVAHAESRGVTVIPEIEMPGHSLAALASHPEPSCTGGPFKVGEVWGVFEDVYCAGNDRTFEFLENVLTEVIDLFPSKYIHIGGDECPKTRWKSCPKCQARMKSEGLKNENELQSYFIRRIEKFLNSKGKRLIGWDEILEGGLAPNATVQSWRGMDGAVAAAQSGHDVICSPTSHCYLDYAQAPLPGLPSSWGFVPLEVVYAFEPTPPELTTEQARHVLGLEGNIWTERAPQERVDTQVFPRLCALAEVGWSPKESRDWKDFQRRMETHYRRLDAMGVAYFIPPPEFQSPGETFTDCIEVAFGGVFRGGTIRYTLDGTDPAADSPKYVKPIRITKTTLVKARAFLRTGRTSEVAARQYRHIRPLEPVTAGPTQPGLEYEYYEGAWTRLPDFDALQPAAVGVAPTFDLSVKKRPAVFAVRYTGLIEIATEGRYTFFLNSDDGSRLTVGTEVVVDHDGPHPPCEKSGQAILKPGLHRIRVEFFDCGGANSLTVGFEGPATPRQPIPSAVLRRPAG